MVVIFSRTSPIPSSPSLQAIAGSIMKCKTGESRKEYVILNVHGKKLCTPQSRTNEHINGMVCLYLPKATDFSKIDKKQLANNRVADQ
jgi:hypothetical protein